MYNTTQIKNSIDFLNNNIAYYKTRIKEAKKIRDTMREYFEKYQLSNDTTQWDEEIELRERDMKHDMEQLNKMKKILKKLEEVEEMMAGA